MAEVEFIPSDKTELNNIIALLPALPTTLFNGQQTVANAGTRVQLHANTPCQYVIIKALPTNTGFIYVGNSTVTSANGYILDGADDAISLAIDNLNKIYIDSSVNTEGVSYIGAN